MYAIRRMKHRKEQNEQVRLDKEMHARLMRQQKERDQEIADLRKKLSRASLASQVNKN